MNLRDTVQRRAVSVSTIFLLGATALLAQVVPQWLQEQERKWLEAFNAGNAAALTALYASDAVILLDQTVRGRAAIKEFEDGYFGATRFTCVFPIDGVQTLDKLTAVWGTSTCARTPKSGGASQTTKGRWLRVYEQQPDGSWIIVRDTGQLVQK
jgi:ketosteroid isomerase-like protein